MTHLTSLVEKLIVRPFISEAQNMPRVLLLLLFILHLGCCWPFSFPVKRTEGECSWRDPCAGGTPVSKMFAMTREEAFLWLSGSCSDLKRSVISLRNEYVRDRFGGDASIAEEALRYSDIVIAGSPSWNASTNSVNEMLLVCFENLARLTMIASLMRKGEQSAEANESHHFASRFNEIEMHPERGLYPILCRLYNLEDEIVEAMSPETKANVDSITFDSAPTSFYRHLRDYRVLLVLENSADQLSLRFDRLAARIAWQASP